MNANSEMIDSAIAKLRGMAIEHQASNSGVPENVVPTGVSIQHPNVDHGVPTFPISSFPSGANQLSTITDVPSVSSSAGLPKHPGAANHHVTETLTLPTHDSHSVGDHFEQTAFPNEHNLSPFPATQGVPANVKPVAPEPSGLQMSKVSVSGIRSFVDSVQGRSTNSQNQVQPSKPATPFHDVSHARFGKRSVPHRPFDLNAIRADFPVLSQKINGHPLAWLDNAATTQKPNCVIDTIADFYRTINSNIHRGAHTLAARSTEAYESAREKVRAFIGAGSVNEIVFVRGTTEGINLIANTYAAKMLQPGNEILLTVLEHHANIVPWQMVAKRTGAVIKVAPINDRGEIIMEEFKRLLGPRTKIVSFSHANNSLGTILPVHEMTVLAKRFGARVVIDGAQTVAHVPTNLQELPADFYVFSGHKVFGPTGIGAVFIREDLHDIAPPWHGGGNMIKDVTFEETTFQEAPAKFEAGTPNIADAIGLGMALDYLQTIGLPAVSKHEHELLALATEELSRINGLSIIGTAREKVAVVSFVMSNRSTIEVGKHLDRAGIAVRAGHHCAQPSLRRFGLETTVRPSFSLYNTKEEVHRLAEALKSITRQQ